MTGPATGDWRKGVVFRWSGKLPTGTYPVTISAQATKEPRERELGRRHGQDRAGPAADAEADPQADAEADPASRPRRPTAKPARTPRPIAEADPRIAGRTRPATDARTDPRRPGPSPTATRDRPSDSLVALGIGASAASAARAARVTRAARARRDRTVGAVRPGGPSQPSGRGWGPLAGLMAMAGLQGPNFTGLTVGPTLVTTTGAVALGMAFGLFGRRRREDESDDSLSAAAASGVGFMASTAVAVGTSTASRPPPAPCSMSTTPKMLMPRWRRPSLIQARKADPIRDTEPAPRLTFDQGLVGPLDGRERKVIRYRVVRLLDSPDELRGSEIGYLDQGDEVQLIEKYGAYWLVLSPDGQQGWLHKMTLGDVYEEDAPPSDRPGRHDADRGRDLDDGRVRHRRRRLRGLPRVAPPPRRADGRLRCAARGCAGGRCSARTRAGSRTAVAASPPGTR